MRNKPVAVLGNNRHETIVWMKREIKVMPLDGPDGRMWVDKDGQQYWIVEDERQTKGVEFSDYMKTPNYASLEDAVKTRIRK